MSNTATAPGGVDRDFDAAAMLRSEGSKIADRDIPTSYRGMYVGKAGLIVDRKVIATLAELASKVGFYDIAVLHYDQLTAAPQL